MWRKGTARPDGDSGTGTYAHIIPEVQLRTVHLLDDAAHEREAVSMAARGVVGLLDGR